MSAKEDNPVRCRCPCLNCNFDIWMNYGPTSVRLTKEQALVKLIQHLEQNHTIGELFEWLERCAVAYFDSEVGGKLE